MAGGENRIPDPSEGAAPDPAVADPASDGAEAAMVVRLGEMEFGIPLGRIREVVRAPPITRVPQVPAAVCGVASVRGDIVAVLDLGLRLLDRAAERPGRLVVVDDERTGDAVALLVDAATGLIEADAERVEEPPAEAEAALPAGMVAGVLAPESGRVVTLLAVQRVLDLQHQTGKEA